VTSSVVGGEEVVLPHGVEGQGLVALLVEQHGQPVGSTEITTP